ncbi:hypothetical protein LP473_10810 [Lactococcus lactis subsp. lactis]|nr:hypothetical protein [Lactococcus lactis]USI60485.1 hypothetical protein LP473_10810 [Lactococcus lactis subsp. lactis]
MTIIASNSFTLSNVNDGSITHVAYANSADGTDGFTTVYPNLNLLDGTKDIKPWATGNNIYNQDVEVIYFNDHKTVADLFKVGDIITLSYDIEFFNTELYNSSNDSAIRIQMLGGGWRQFSQVYAKNVNGKFYTKNEQISSEYVENPTHKVNISITMELDKYFIESHGNSNAIRLVYDYIPKGADTKLTNLKIEPAKDLSSIATLYMQSASEVTTADYPSYIGQYTDFTQADSTNPSDYTWSLIRGNDGKDGVGIKTTTITYAGSTSGTTAPSSGWTSTVPTVAAGSYLWTKTIWTYTDNTSETGYSVAKMGNNGSNGDPGKVVSDTEPTTRFKGLTWKYSGTTDLTASDRTVIHPNTEYYYNGTHWVINYFSVNNFAAESITSDKIDGKNLTITDGEFVSTTTNGPVTTSTEIKDNHIAISKTDGTVNTRNDIALDSEQGLAQKFTNINTGFYRTAGINYQGPFTSDSDGNYAQLTPQGTKLSTDVPWTKLSLMNNFNGNIEYAIINGTVYISASGVGVPAMTAGQWKQAAQLPTGSSAIPIRANRIAAGDSGDGLSWALLSNQAGGIFIRCSANKAPTPNLFNATLPYPIG